MTEDVESRSDINLVIKYQQQSSVRLDQRLSIWTHLESQVTVLEKMPCSYSAAEQVTGQEDPLFNCLSLSHNYVPSVAWYLDGLDW